LYAPFETNMKSTSADVYYHEMPGGQYTNLKFQVRGAAPQLVLLQYKPWHLCRMAQQRSS
jgi:pyruvate carboxylase